MPDDDIKMQEATFWKYYSYRREDDAWDYKQDISIETDEFAELAKDILAFANFGGGYLLLGVEKGTHRLLGVKHRIDEAELGQCIEGKLHIQLGVKLLYFNHNSKDGNLILGLVYIPPGDSIMTSAHDLHKKNGKGRPVEEHAIYYRRNTRSVKVTGEDVKRINQRINKRQSENQMAIRHEQSALRKARGGDVLDFYEVLFGSFEVTAETSGRKLFEIWQYQTKYNKAEFATLLQISPADIDAYFEGRESLDISRMITVTRMFHLRSDYFFIPTYNMRPPYWTEDLVKYAILSSVRPKSAISGISNDGRFYSGILKELAEGICELYSLLYSGESQFNDLGQTEETKSAWYLHEKIPNSLKSDMEKQYYKLLDQYPRNIDRSLMPHEKILRSWFNADAVYIARLIVEGIEAISIRKDKRVIVRLRFMRDLLKREVRVRHYNSEFLRMEK